jgi:hypothetical protein
MVKYILCAVDGALHNINAVMKKQITTTID